MLNISDAENKDLKMIPIKHDHRWYNLIEPIQGKYARVCLSCNLYQFRNDLDSIWKDYSGGN